MVNFSSIGYFPFCIRELAEDGEPFEQWDQTTVLGGTSSDNTPSKSTSEFITVYGSGTKYFIGLTFDQLFYLFWRGKKLKIAFDPEAEPIEMNLPEISVTDGYWDDSVSPPEWIEVPRTAEAIDMIVTYPDDATGTGDTWDSPAETEIDLVCLLGDGNADGPIWPNFEIQMEKTEVTFDEEAVDNAYNLIIFYLTISTLHLGSDVIKGDDGLYYVSTGLPSEFNPWFSYSAIVYHYGYNASAGTYPDVNVDVVYPFSIYNQANFVYQLVGAVDTDTLSTKELTIHIDFPESLGGRTTFTTKLWGGATDGFPASIPNIVLVLTFEEEWEHT